VDAYWFMSRCVGWAMTVGEEWRVSGWVLDCGGGGGMCGEILKQ